MPQFKDALREMPEYQAAMAAAEGASESEQVETVEAAVEPVISLEKGDLEFWMQVTTVVLLYLIWREQAGRAG